MPGDFQLVMTCEHGGNKVPSSYRKLFAAHRDLLASHRGWDPGTRSIGEAWGKRLGVDMHLSTVTRLLVDLNRSEHHRNLFSEITRCLPDDERQAIKADYYHPHRNAVAAEIEQWLSTGAKVLHIALHSFTPVMGGVERNAEIGLLYDPSREGERRLCKRWGERLANCPLDERQHPAGLVLSRLRVRANYPYRGNADGLTTHFRRRFGCERYLGIEIEFNQLLVDHRGKLDGRLVQNTLDALLTALES
jgi:predicted N-formylglutamate amidohydrolase